MEEFEELFYRDPYRKTFDAEVVTCEKGKGGWHVVLDDTAFYPEGGGQPGDRGRLNDIPVTDTQRIDGQVVHLCEKAIAPGTAVHGELDWQWRFENMQSHTGEHIVSGLIHKKFGYENVGFHMGDVIQIDFDGEMTWPDVMQIEREANAAIYRNVDVRCWFPDAAELQDLPYRSKKELNGRVRLVTIDGVDQCACCGTQVKRTGEIGMIKLLSLSAHRGGVRIDMLAGARALAYTEGIYRENEAVSHLLSAPMTSTAAAVKKLLNHADEMEMQVHHWMAVSLENQAERIADGEKLVLLFEKGMDRNTMRHFATQLLDEKHCGTVGMFNLEDNGSYSYMLLSGSVALRGCAKELNAKLNGRGGGKDNMIQGSFKADRETIEKVIRQMWDAQ